MWSSASEGMAQDVALGEGHWIKVEVNDIAISSWLSHLHKCWIF